MGLVFGQKLSDTLQYVKAEINNSVKQGNNRLRHLLNRPADDNTSVDKVYNSKKQNFDAANCNVPNIPKILHHVRTSLFNVYKTLINNDYLSIVYVALKIEAKRIQVSQVTRFLLFEMVYHNKPPNFKFCITKMIQNA